MSSWTSEAKTQLENTNADEKSLTQKLIRDGTQQEKRHVIIFCLGYQLISLVSNHYYQYLFTSNSKFYIFLFDWQVSSMFVVSVGNQIVVDQEKKYKS